MSDGGHTGVRGTSLATAAIAGSAIFHVGLLAALDLVDDHAPRRATLVTPRLLLEPLPAPPRSPLADAIPIELVMMAPPAAATSTAPVAPPVAPPPTAAAPLPHDRSAPPVADGAIAPAPSAIAATLDPGTSTAVEPATGPEEPGLLSMRTAPRGLRPMIDPWRAHLTVAAPDPSRQLPDPPEPSGLLHSDGGGTFRTVEPGFVGHVAADGRISFEDKPSFTIHVNVPRPRKIARAIGQGLERWFDDPEAAIRAGVPDPDVARGDSATEQQKPDHSNPEATILPIITGGFDATDAVMRMAGMDPYASAKLKWMDETRDERLRLRRTHRLAALGQSTQSMRRNLARLWARPDLDDAARRAALFELWDDCFEDGDDAVIAACTRTRAAVLGFIRGHLPVGSPTAYTADELRALNGRRVSSTPFAPYD